MRDVGREVRYERWQCCPTRRRHRAAEASPRLRRRPGRRHVGDDRHPLGRLHGGRLQGTVAGRGRRAVARRAGRRHLADLAGVGVGSWPAAGSGTTSRWASSCRTALLLLAAGFGRPLLVWKGDILRVWGVSLVVAAALLGVGGRRLLTAAGGFVLGFWRASFDSTRTGTGTLTPTRAVDGRRNCPQPVLRRVAQRLPVDGTAPLRDVARAARPQPHPAFNTRFCWPASPSWPRSNSSRHHPVRSARRAEGSKEAVSAIRDQESIPPLPLFFLSAGGTATAMMAACVRLTRGTHHEPRGPLAATGQLALTWYVATGSLSGLGQCGRWGTGTTSRWAVAPWRAGCLLLR